VSAAEAKVRVGQRCPECEHEWVSSMTPREAVLQASVLLGADAGYEPVDGRLLGV
jgi:hypothetical protein